MHKRYLALFVNIFLFTVSLQAQWLDWEDITDTNLSLSSVANSDDEEKDMEPADLNNDGFEDLIVVRKVPFSNPTEPEKSDLLLMNTGGALVDQTALYAPGFINNPTHARDVFIGDFDDDGWKDVIVANTFDQAPMYYRNRGNDSNGNWLGLVDESATRFPATLDDVPLICAVKGGDINGDGFMDIYFVNYKQNAAGGIAQDFLFINDGNGNFTEEAMSRMGNLRNSAFGTEVEIKDIDNDGDQDIIKVSTLYNVAPWNSRGVLVLYNEGTGTFSNWQNISQPVSGSPYMIEIEDFNLDGKLDLYVIDDGVDYLLKSSVITPNSNIVFISETINSANTNGFGGNVHAIDFDLDGDMDIAVADVDVDIPPCNSARRFVLLRNDNGSFTDPYGNSPQDWATNAYDFSLIDINNDGLSDFVLGKCEGYGVFLSDNCDLAPLSADFDLDGLADACDPCPANPDPNCDPDPNYPVVSTDLSLPRQWNELLLESIRQDLARPTVHARNLFHTSAAMWDAWAIYNTDACNYLIGESLDGFTCDFSDFTPNGDPAQAIETTISYAMYRILSHRFANSSNIITLQAGYDNHMAQLGHDINFTSVNYQNGSAAALGNFIAQCYINFGLQDNSNEQNDYGNTAYQPVNTPLVVDNPGNPTISDLNRWQPLTLEIFIDQSGNVIPGATPDFLSPEWGAVSAFALEAEDANTYQRDGFDYKVYHDPGAPPTLQANGAGNSDDYKWGFSTVLTWSSHLDPTDGVMLDISPGTMGNANPFPTNFGDYPNYYDQINGGVATSGHSVNPVTGQAYAANLVPRGDFARVVAEFWADGPDSETPPGHWFTILNEYVADHPDFEKRFQGQGPILDDMEWYIKSYFTLGGAMHDAAVTSWGIKGWYDYIRPISAIRGMAEKGQSSNPNLASYDPEGLPLIAGYIELVNAGDPLVGAGNINLGKIKIKAWQGHDLINNVDTDEAGVDWILAENWVPYQRPSFVTPNFAGYVSGHSTFSRSAATVLSLLTGSDYFPGGMGTYLAEKDEFLVFEDGPSVDVELQWATFQDAANQSALSRIWGGIHPPADDIPGRIMGQQIGTNAFNKAFSFFEDNNNNGNPDLCEAPDPCASLGGDSDGDGICDDNDNCPNTANPNQSDTNGNGIGDVCDTPTNGDCDDLVITTGNGTIIVSGLDAAPIMHLQIFSAAWVPQYSCAVDCDPVETISLSAGDYIVSVKLYTSTWQPICDIQQTVTVTTGGDPCAGLGGDSDGDGVCNDNDNCPNTSNPDQSDSDNNGIGDACDTVDPCANLGGDSDGDGVCNDNDNCPNTSNPNQSDTDNDGIGDACDTPSNGDCDDIIITTGNGTLIISGLNTTPIMHLQVFSATWEPQYSCAVNCNPVETLNLPAGDYIVSVKLYTSTWQPVCQIQQTVTVTTGGDPCANLGGDSDGDGICNDNDNCPTVSNPSQSDTDNNGIGDACDTVDPCASLGGDSDGDGICDDNDNCPSIANPNQSDTDNDGIGDVCDTPSNGDCDDIVITTGDGTLSISGLNATPIMHLQVFSATWEPQYSCVANCNPVETLNLPAGDYIVSVKLYTSTWQPVCQIQQTVTVTTGGGGDPCASLGGDSDGDGICDDNDNCPNDANPNQADTDNDGTGDACETANGDCDLVSISPGSNSLTVDGLDAAPIVHLQIFTSSWQGTYQCSTDCGTSETVSLAPGDYIVSVKLYTSSWQPICDFVTTVTVGGIAPKIQEILALSAVQENQSVALQWNSNMDHKTKNYFIERSTDGVRFERIMERDREAQASAAYLYRSIDQAPLLGKNIYRIHQVFEDGTERYSNEETVIFWGDPNKVVLFPNPTKTELFVSLKEFKSKSVTIQIFNHLGQRMDILEVVEGEDLVKFDVSKYPSGAYTMYFDIEEMRNFARLFVVSRL